MSATLRFRQPEGGPLLLQGAISQPPGQAEGMLLLPQAEGMLPLLQAEGMPLPLLQALPLPVGVVLPLPRRLVGPPRPQAGLLPPRRQQEGGQSPPPPPPRRQEGERPPPPPLQLPEARAPLRLLLGQRPPRQQGGPRREAPLHGARAHHGLGAWERGGAWGTQPV